MYFILTRLCTWGFSLKQQIFLRRWKLSRGCSCTSHLSHGLGQRWGIHEKYKSSNPAGSLDEPKVFQTGRGRSLATAQLLNQAGKIRKKGLKIWDRGRCSCPWHRWALNPKFLEFHENSCTALLPGSDFVRGVIGQVLNPSVNFPGFCKLRESSPCSWLDGNYLNFCFLEGHLQVDPEDLGDADWDFIYLLG